MSVPRQPMPPPLPAAALVLLSILAVTACRKSEEAKSTRPAAAAPPIHQVATRPEKTSRPFTLDAWQATGLPGSLAGRAFSDLPSALDFAKSLPRAERNTAVEAVLRASFAHQAEFVSRELSNSGLPYSTKGEIATDLIKFLPDAKKALAWADKSMTGVNRGPVIAAALARVVAESPADAATFIEKMPPGSSRDDAVRGTIRAWAKTDLQAAIHYAGTQPNDPVAKDEAEWLYGTWAQTDPSTAEAFFLKSPDDDRLGMMGALLAVGRAQKESPAAAMAWAHDLPAGKSGDRARVAAFAELSKADPAAAARWTDPHHKDDP